MLRQLMTVVRRVRQHHAIEHATMTILAAGDPDVHLIARSDHHGFVVYGDVDTERLAAAVEEALRRLRRGESHLAVHPNCGTNIVTAGLLAGFASYAVTSRRRRWYDQLPFALSAGILSLLAAQPLGRLAQERLTTLPEVSDVALKDVTVTRSRGRTVHRVRFRHGSAPS